MIIHLNFAQNTHMNSQRINSETAINIGNCDISHRFSFKDIDTEFFEKNKSIFSEPLGAGLWLWKPYLILKVLQSAKDEDGIIYTDAGCHFINSVSPLISLFSKEQQDIIPFTMDPIPTNRNILQTKRDCFVYMNCDSEEYYNCYALTASFILLKKSKFTLDFVSEWLKYCQDRRILSDDISITPNFKEFNTHRHDQSVYTNLVKKYNLKYFRDPSQWGNSFDMNKNDYGQLINQTRNYN